MTDIPSGVGAVVLLGIVVVFVVVVVVVLLLVLAPDDDGTGEVVVVVVEVVVNNGIDADTVVILGVVLVDISDEAHTSPYIKLHLLLLCRRPSGGPKIF